MKKPNNLIAYIEGLKAPKPIALEVNIIKVQGTQQGYTSYTRVYINSVDVTNDVALAGGWNLSKDKKYYGCILLHGGNMDMGTHLQNWVWKAFKEVGKEYLVTDSKYIRL